MTGAVPVVACMPRRPPPRSLWGVGILPANRQDPTFGTLAPIADRCRRPAGNSNCAIFLRFAFHTQPSHALGTPTPTSLSKLNCDHARKPQWLIILPTPIKIARQTRYLLLATPIVD